MLYLIYVYIGYFQPTCIDKYLCSSPPFDPVCGTALPPCSTSNIESRNVAATEKPLPTLSPLTTKQPYYAYKMNAPQLNLPPRQKQAPQPVNSKAIYYGMVNFARGQCKTLQTKFCHAANECGSFKYCKYYACQRCTANMYT